MSLVARHLEAHGIPTVIAGSARDIVEECGVPRFLFSDFPLGNPLGRPWGVEMQRRIISGGGNIATTTTPPPAAAEEGGSGGSNDDTLGFFGLGSGASPS